MLSIKIVEVIKEYDFDLLYMYYVVFYVICGILVCEMLGKDIKIMIMLYGIDIIVLGYDYLF